MNSTSQADRHIRWGPLALGLFFSVCAILILAFTGFLLLYVTANNPGQNKEESLSMLMLAGGSLAIGGLLIPGIYLNLHRVFNRTDFNFSFPKFEDRNLLTGLITIWFVTLALGIASSGNSIFTALFLPLLNVLAVGLPILYYLRISLKGLELPSIYRGWSLFGATLIISPTLAFLFEFLVLGIIVVFVIIYASISPGLKDILNSIYTNLKSGGRNETEMVHLAANLIFMPGIAITTLGTFSIIVPIIEESCKVMLILPIINRIHRPVDGYILGIICGAAFALVENIGFTSSGSTDWTLNILTRSSAALPHMFNSGLFGWALVSTWQNHRFGRLLLTFLAIILVHGSWNAISLGLAVNSFSPYLSSVPVLFQNSYPWVAAWIILATGTFGGLIFNNYQMRKLMKKDAEENLGYNSGLILKKPGDNENGDAENID